MQPSSLSRPRPLWHQLGWLALLVATMHALLLAPGLARRPMPAVVVAPGRAPALLTRALPATAAPAATLPADSPTMVTTHTATRPTLPATAEHAAAATDRPSSATRRARMPVSLPARRAAAGGADPRTRVALAGSAAETGHEAPPHAITHVSAAPTMLTVAMTAQAPALNAAAASMPAPAAAEPPTYSAPSPQAQATAPSHAAAAARAAPSTRLVYQVSGQARGIPYHASATLDWQQDGSRYTAQWQLAGPLGLTRQQSSAGAITPQGLAPERFGERSRSERATHFERSRGRIVFSSNTPEAELATGAQDRLSVTLQAGALIASAPLRYPPGTQITLQVAGPRDASVWTFNLLGDETLNLAGQSVPCLKLERSATDPHGQHIELWLAPGYHYLPVRLRISQGDGDVADQQLAELPDQ